ncbi:uncharacterized protein LOC130411322 isoform X2 [Triplophysa dalaica]|nr:uncharacterized protein LOC130411322 isoform X2 [Triplophysa dalaica]
MQQDFLYEVVQKNGSLAKSKSHVKMDGEWILKCVGRRIYYRNIFNSIDETNIILRKAHLEKVNHNYYFPYEINKTFLELLAISGGKSKKQQAILWLKHKDGTYKQYGPFPGGPKKHSEDYIIEILIDKQFNASDYTECWIYSTNCPCLCKNNWELKDHNPCMINLYAIRIKFEKDYNIKTYVGFSRFYGISGSFMELLPYNPIKQNNYPIKKNIKQTIKQKEKRIDMLKDFDNEFLNKSNELITELKDRKFKIKKDEFSTEYKSKYSDLIKDIPDIFKDMVLQELQELFQYFTYPATFDQFIVKGWKKLANLREKLATDNLNYNVQQSFFKNVEENFLDWWDKIVKKASSTFLNENLNEDFKKLTFQVFLNEIPDPHKNFIGCLDHTIEHFHPEIQPNNVIVI